MQSDIVSKKYYRQPPGACISLQFHGLDFTLHRFMYHFLPFFPLNPKIWMGFIYGCMSNDSSFDIEKKTLMYIILEFEKFHWTLLASHWLVWSITPWGTGSEELGFIKIKHAHKRKWSRRQASTISHYASGCNSFKVGLDSYLLKI